MNETELIVAIIVMLAGMTLLLAMQLLTSLADWAPESIQDALRLMARVLVSLGILGVCLAITPSFGWIAWLVVMCVWIRSAMHLRAMQKRSLLGALALAVDKQMPLAPMAMAFADEQHGGFGRSAQALADRLSEGIPLVEAIAKSRGALPPEAAMAARVAEESGDLSGAFEATTQGGRFDRTLVRTAIWRLFYFLPAILLFITFMKVKIEPSLLRIFDDFGTSLPNITIAVSRQPSPTIVGSLLLGLTIAATGYLGLAWIQWRGWMTPTLPGLKRIIKWVDMGVVLRVLALAARKNCPLPRMLGALAATHPKPAVRRRLRAVVTDINEGSPWQKSLQFHRLIGPADAALLSAAQRSGNLGWALAEMADSFQRKATYRMHALAQVILPLLMIPMGILVCLLAVAYFVPLVKLVKDLS